MIRGGLSMGSLLLAATAAALVALIAAEWRDARWRPPAASFVSTPASDNRPHEASGLAGRAGSGELVAQILARPLFAPDRRPEETATGPTEPSLGRLSGVMVSSVGREAIFDGGAQGKTVVLPEGGRLGQYLVESISGNSVTLVGPAGRRVVHPVFDTVGGGRTSPSAAPSRR
jgi:hypothetical protein